MSRLLVDTFCHWRPFKNYNKITSYTFTGDPVSAWRTRRLASVFKQRLSFGYVSSCICFCFVMDTYDYCSIASPMLFWLFVLILFFVSILGSNSWSGRTEEQCMVFPTIVILSKFYCVYLFRYLDLYIIWQISDIVQ